MTQKKLYEIKQDGETKYGNKLAVDSNGNWVMELIGGTGGIISVPKTSVEEVRPHTISISFEKGKTKYAYLADKGKYQVGEFYIFDSRYGRSIVEVTAVDTKSSSAITEFTPIAKLLTEKV